MDIKNYRDREKSSNYADEYRHNNNMLSLDARRSLTEQHMRRVYLDHASIIDIFFMDVEDGVPSIALGKEVTLCATIYYQVPDQLITSKSRTSEHRITLDIDRVHLDAIGSHYNNEVIPYYTKKNEGRKKKHIVSIHGFLHGSNNQENELMPHVNAFMWHLQDQLAHVESEVRRMAEHLEKYDRGDKDSATTGKYDESLAPVLTSIKESNVCISIALTDAEKKYFNRGYLYLKGLDKSGVKAGYDSPVCANLLGYAQRRRLQLWLYEEMYNTEPMDPQYWVRLDRRIFNTVDPVAHNPMKMSLPRLMLHYYGPEELGGKELVTVDDMKVNRDTFEKFVSVLKTQCFTMKYHKKKIEFREEVKPMKKSKSAPKLTYYERNKEKVLQKQKEKRAEEKKSKPPKILKPSYYSRNKVKVLQQQRERRERIRSMKLSTVRHLHQKGPLKQSPPKRKVFSCQPIEVVEGEKVVVNLNDHLKHAVVRKNDPIKLQVQIDGDYENWYNYSCLIKASAFDDFSPTQSNKKSKLNKNIRQGYGINVINEPTQNNTNIAKKEAADKRSNEDRAKKWQQELEERAAKMKSVSPEFPSIPTEKPAGDKTNPVNLSDTEDEEEEFQDEAIVRSVSIRTQEGAATLTGFNGGVDL